ncbi:MAG: hydrolase [Mycobacterium sp.]|nr:hydrolase [Mycobacterium sp.]MCW2746234.1 hydrolase [Mycobacterium sp.]
MPRTSAGLLLARRRPDPPEAGRLEFFLVHPGGPYFARKDAGVWGIPKGELEPGEDARVAAVREFAEETGFVLADEAELVPLGPVRLRSGKQVLAWLVEQDVDADALVSNTCPVQWPPGSGRWIDIPEVDRGAWFPLDAALEKMAERQRPLVAEAARLLSG